MESNTRLGGESIYLRTICASLLFHRNSSNADGKTVSLRPLPHVLVAIPLRGALVNRVGNGLRDSTGATIDSWFSAE